MTKNLKKEETIIEENNNFSDSNILEEMKKLQDELAKLKSQINNEKITPIKLYTSEDTNTDNEFVVISLFQGTLGLRTRAEQITPSLKLSFNEKYTIRSKPELEEFYRINKFAFSNGYLLFESPSAVDVLHIQDKNKEKFDMETYNNLGNLSLIDIERVYKECKKWQKDSIINKFIEEAANGNPNFSDPKKLKLLQDLRNREVPETVWNERKNETENSYIFNINNNITAYREKLSENK